MTFIMKKPDSFRLSQVCRALLCALVWILPQAVGGQEALSLHEELAQDISDRRLDRFSRIEAAFILSGLEDPDSLEHGLAWYRELLGTLQGFGLDPFDDIGSASKVFSYLHGVWLVHYSTDATTLADVMRSRTYNCVSGTLLYNLLCEALGWNTEAFETPSHVYTLFSDFTEEIRVENTSAIGFDIMKNLKTYSLHLAEYYPQNEVLKIGLDKLYDFENSHGRAIDNTELLGLLAYNRAVYARRRGNFEEAFHLVTLAQDFNGDSRSNVRFEMGLYGEWGMRLFEKGEFEGAFHIFADAAYRYPEESAFVRNCRASFFNVLVECWRGKDWQRARECIREMAGLDFLRREDTARVESMLEDWRGYFTGAGNKEKEEEVIALGKLIR